jgi:hypothetical protein
MAHALNASTLSANTSTDAAPKKGVFARLFDAMVASRYHSAARELRRHDALLKGLESNSGVSAWTLPFQSDSK